MTDEAVRKWCEGSTIEISYARTTYPNDIRPPHEVVRMCYEKLIIPARMTSLSPQRGANAIRSLYGCRLDHEISD